MSLFFQQLLSSRLDWFGFGIASANRTAAFIACAILAVWIFSACKKTIAWWFSFILTSGLLFCLILTKSRGAFVALGISAIVLFFNSKIIFTKSRVIALTILFSAAFAFSVYQGFASRFTKMCLLESSSANCRKDIYLSGIKMFADAPEGLSERDKPIDIYMRYYQSQEDSDTFLSMINSHLEAMCGNGFATRFLYVTLWIFALGISFPREKNTISAVSFSVILCVGISACFSNILNYWVVWILPILLLLFAIFQNRKRLLSPIFYLTIFFASSAFILLVYLISFFLSREASFRFYTNSDVLIGEGKPVKILLYRPIERVLGMRFGGELAKWSALNNCAIFVSENFGYSKYCTAIICSPDGDFSKLSSEKIIFLNTYPPANIDSLSGKNVVAVFGAQADWRMKKAWRNLKESSLKFEIIELNGVADYIPNWSDYLNK